MEWNSGINVNIRQLKVLKSFPERQSDQNVNYLLLLDVPAAAETLV